MSNSSRGPGRKPSSNRGPNQRPFSGKAQKVPSTFKSPSRQRLESLSYKPLKFIHSMPRLILPIVMGALLLAGLLIPSPLAGILLIVLGLLLVWLVALSWPAIESSAKIIRCIVIVLVFVASFWKLSGNA